MEIIINKDYYFSNLVIKDEIVICYIHYIGNIHSFDTVSCKMKWI